MNVNFNFYNKNKVIIIGGGYSALTLAVSLAEKIGGENITILEKLQRVGKKILSTGNGQCNLTANDISINHYHGENPIFAESALTRFSENSVFDFYNNLGIKLISEGEKVYPASKQASCIVDALRLKIENSKINLLTEFKVISVSKKNKIFTVTAEDGRKVCGEILVLSAGGKCAKHLGTDGDGYNLAKSLGHSVTAIYPSLVQLKTNCEKIKGLKGIKSQVLLSVFTDNKLITQVRGDLLFTDYGISGNSVFYASSYVAGKNNVKLLIDFLPDFSLEEIENSLSYKSRKLRYLKKEDYLSGLINKQIGKAVMKLSGEGDFDKSIENCNYIKIAKTLKNFPLTVTGTIGFDYAQVTKGGIKTSEINNISMESLIVDNLYFTGEIIDIDGDCGGYNLQWAFSSAMCVSESIFEKVKL